MKCKNCGAQLHDGDTFCRTCAAPVDNSIVENKFNIATDQFASSLKKVKPPINISKEIIPLETEKTKAINNKDLLDKEPNNRIKATIINITGLAILLIIIFILLFLFIKFIKYLGK